MSRIVRIARKLITTPGPSVRDYLLRKHPLANENPSSNYFVSIQQGLMQPTFPVDVVYTWVDSEDPDFRQSLGKHRQTDNCSFDRPVASEEESVGPGDLPQLAF